MNKKNLGLIALFILLIAAVVLLTAGETREEDAPLPDIRLTEIVPHSTQINADGYAMGSITLTSFADAPADLAGWGLADRVYKVKYVFERGTTLAPGESLTVYLAGKHGAKGTLRYASFGLSAKHEEHVYLYAADGRTSDEIYARFAERSVGVENRIHDFRIGFDKIAPYLALAVLAIFAIAVFVSVKLAG